MPNEEITTITETAPDGTVTTIDITSTKPDDAAAGGDDKTIVEEIVEALFDEGDADDDADETDDPAMYGLTPTDDEISTNSTEFTIGRDSFPSIDIPPGVIGPPVSDAPDPGLSTAAPDPIAQTDAETSAVDTAAADQQVHADAAKEAQDAADGFVAQGDYKAAAEARETAENESYAAGDSSMLGSSDSGDLANAGYQQDNANYYREQQAEHTGQGDYEAAKSDAQNVAYATGDADYKAGGSDHTAQADKDVANLDWAVWDQKNADGSVQNAEYYAAQGNFDQAQTALDQAGTYEATADEYGASANPGSEYYHADASSEVASGGSYDAGAVDTGFDAGAGAAVSYEPPVDDV